jgi:hypothetical protein
LPRLESLEEIGARAEAARLFGPERVFLNPDCGFAAFADNPLASAEATERKLRMIVAAARMPWKLILFARPGLARPAIPGSVDHTSISAPVELFVLPVFEPFVDDRGIGWQSNAVQIDDIAVDN